MPVVSVSWIGALVGLALAIILILRRLNPVYALLLGAVIGSLVGGANLAQTTQIVITGSQSVMGTVVRVIAAGVLAGAMMESGAADVIARTIVNKLGDNMAIFALALATMLITSVGVFITVSIIIVAPIAMAVGKKLNISKLALLVALSGGGKAGNIISPNPNTIAAASGFHIETSALMIADFVPALFGLAMAVLVASLLRNKGAMPTDRDIIEKEEENQNHPSVGASFVAPVVAIVLLLINPLGEILHIHALEAFQIDAMYILPFAGIVGILAMKQGKHIMEYTRAGLMRMTDVVLILIGAGAIGGLISSSNLSTEIVKLINEAGISGTLLAPIAGILMAAATASTSTGVILGTGSFGKTILSFGVSPVGAAVMMHTGATVVDELPHGNYFHVTGNAMHMDIKQRLRVIPYEAIVGLTMTIVGTIMYGYLMK